MIGENYFWENFVRLCNEHDTKPNPVAKELGISSGTVTGWKKGSAPRDTAIRKIADYFNVPPEYLLGKTDQKEKPTLGDLIVLDNRKIRMAPLYESVSAGFGATAQDFIVDYIPLFIKDDAEAEETLCIRVTGDSMYPKIENGDIIQVHKQSSVDSGAIAVVLLDGEEGLVKRVVYGTDWIELQSINPMYPPRRFEGTDVLRLQVVGLVRKIIKDI